MTLSLSFLLLGSECNGFLTGFPISVFVPLLSVTSAELKEMKSAHSTFGSQSSHGSLLPTCKAKALKSPTKQL